MRLVLLAAGVGLWGTVLYGSTRLHEHDLVRGYDICGPWGCAAEPEALIGYHAVLASLIVPAVGLVCRAAPRGVGIRLSRVVATLGFFGLSALAGWAAATWLRGTGDPAYTPQRVGFVVATTPDLPVLQLLVGGIAGRLACVGPGRPVEPSGASRDNRSV